MGLESVSTINDLVPGNPPDSDTRSQGAAHLRLIKTVLQACFPGLDGIQWRTISKNANYTMLATDNYTVVKATAAMTLSLTAAATLGNGFAFVLFNEHSAAVTVDPSGGELINSALTYTVQPSEAVLVFGDGTEFKAIALNYVSPFVTANITAKGDTVVGTGTDTAVVKAVGSKGHVQYANANSTGGIAWSGPGPALFTGKVDVTMAGNAVTLAVKTLAGATPTADAPVLVAMPNNTGDYTVYSIESALTMTISAGSSLGSTDNNVSRIYFGLADDGGTLRLWAHNPYKESDKTLRAILDGVSYSSTAEGGAGAADSAHVIYSTTAFTSKQVRTLGYFESTQTTAGTWNAAASKIRALMPWDKRTGDVIKEQAVDVGSSNTTTQAENDIPGASLSFTPDDLTNIVKAIGIFDQRSDASTTNNACTSKAYLKGGGSTIAFGLGGGGSGTGSNGIAGAPTRLEAVYGPITGAVTFKLARGSSFWSTITTYTNSARLVVEEIMR